MQISGLSTSHEVLNVYNIFVDDLHCYCVGNCQVLVHNNSGPSETFNNPADAIGDLNGEATLVATGKTKDGQWNAWGYTDTHYYRDSDGVKWTVFYNPSTGLFSGAHPSSGK